MSRGRRNTLPRRSSIKGIFARFEARLKDFNNLRVPDKSKKGFKKPGSMNPRKVGR